MNALAAYGVFGLIVLILIFAYGRQKGKMAENRVVRKALEDAGLAKDEFDKIMARPTEPVANLFDDGWRVSDKDDS